jgi:hypothetical protein
MGAAQNNSQAARLYASSLSNTTVPGTWYSTLTSATPSGNRYLWTLVRLAQNANSTTTAAPSVSGLDATWNSATTQPDGWALNLTGGTHALALSPSRRRFGTRSAKFTVGGTTNAISAYRNTAGDGVPVSPNTIYTFSCYVFDNGTSGVGSSGVIKLKVFQGAASNATLSDADLYATSDPHTSFLAIDKDPTTGIGWRRMSVTFDSGDNSVIRPVVECTNFTSGNIIFVDGALVEEGSVIRSYTPGTVNSPAVVEGMGVQIDGSAGGKMRLRGSSASARDIVQLGANGLDFGTTSPVSIYQTADGSNSLTVSGALAALSTITQNGSAVSTVGHTHIQTESHYSPDTDTATSSLHHTIGTSATQAAAGNHAHSGTTIALAGDLTLAATALTLGGANSYNVAVNNDSHSHTGTTISGLTLGTDVGGNYVASLVAGTGVTLANNSGSGATPTVSIGQAVATTSNVTFANLSATGSVTFTTPGTVTLGTVAGDNVRITNLYQTSTITNSFNPRMYNGSGAFPWRFFYDTSSERFKTNIVYMEDTDAILDVNPVSYHDKVDYEVNGEESPRQYGFLAEEMGANPEGIAFVVHNGADAETIQYERLVVPLFSAMRKLRSRIDELEARIAELEGRE